MKTGHDISLEQFTSYHIGGVAKDVHFPTNADELAGILGALSSENTPWFLIGGGSNLLIGDGYWDGAVVVTTAMDSITISSNHLTSGAGATSTKVAETARDHSLTGLEFLFRLPGTIGGAVSMNARFNMRSVSDCLVSIEAVHPDGSRAHFRREDIDFSYKHTGIISEGWIIAEATFVGDTGESAAIDGRMMEIERFRDEHNHFAQPSCGCIFKNEHAKNVQAGQLIDSLGLKGVRIGDAEVSVHHANFIVNRGNATAADVLALIEHIENTVREKTGISLEREVVLKGTFVPPSSPFTGNN